MEKSERERRKFSFNFVAVDGKNERIEIKQSFFLPSSRCESEFNAEKLC
jgi:hypothetical protein